MLKRADFGLSKKGHNPADYGLSDSDSDSDFHHCYKDENAHIKETNITYNINTIHTYTVLCKCVCARESE